MRLVAVVDSLGLGGAERLLVTLARHASGADLQLGVLALRDVGSTVVTDGLAAEGVDVRYVTTRCRHHLADPFRFVRLAHELSRARPDVVQTHLGTANVLGVAAARLTGLPVVGTLHNVRLVGGGPRQRSEDAVLRRADAIVAVGQEVARATVRRWPPARSRSCPTPWILRCSPHAKAAQRRFAVSSSVQRRGHWFSRSVDWIPRRATRCSCRR